jgi:hypothetical protein
MIDAPKQQMLGIFSVFVRWVSDVKQVSSGKCIRVRSVIGKQWSTLQIPIEIAPKLKNGDFIEVVGSVTALPDRGGASNFLFVQEVRQHIPAEQIRDSQSSNNTSRSQGPEHSRPSTSTLPPSGASQVDASTYSNRSTPPDSPTSQKRSGGYRSNRKRSSENEVEGQRQVDVNVQAYANDASQVSNRPAPEQPAQAQAHSPSPAPQTHQRPIRGYSRNRRRSQIL